MKASYYNNFEEVEKEIIENAPATVYKYRLWKEDFHKTILTDQNLWFSHPFDLNDPLDVRPQTQFDERELFNPAYLDKLIANIPHQYSQLSREKQIEIAKEQWGKIKSAPQILIENLRIRQETRENFDQYGVFSTSFNGLNNTLWEMYAENHTGFCVGFKTVEICRNIKSQYGLVIYSDDPFQYSFFGHIDDKLDRLYLKKKKWSPEEEFRFITVGIGIHSERTQKFLTPDVAEIILGYNISPIHKQEILEVLEKHYPKDIPVYITKNADNGILVKEKIR